MAKDVAEKLEELASGLNTKLFKIKIRECNAIKEAQANQTNIYDYKKIRLHTMTLKLYRRIFRRKGRRK